MLSRPDTASIADGDQYVFPDAGKAGLEATCSGLVKSGRSVVQKHKRVAAVLHWWPSIVGRRARGRGTINTHAVDQVFMASKGPLKLPLKGRVGFVGRSATNGIGPLPMVSVGPALNAPPQHYRA